MIMIMMMIMMTVGGVRSEAEQQDQYLDELEHLREEGKRPPLSSLDWTNEMSRSPR